MSLSGHTSFVYSVAALPDGSGVVSSGEDVTMRVWKGEWDLEVMLTDQMDERSKPSLILPYQCGPYQYSTTET